MQFIQEFDNLCLDAYGKIKTMLDADTKPFKNSEVYDSRTEIKMENLEERVSQFRLFNDKSLFDQCDRIVTEINKVNDNIYFRLFRNDLTHIKYGTGEFFKPHQDYLSLTGNLVTEYTLILCIDADCEGGETVLHLNRHFKHKSTATITPGHCLLFRKDICHEGALVKSGKKEILSLNVWGLDKDKGTDEILIVTFPESTVSYEIPTKNILVLHIENSITAFLNFKKDGLKEKNLIWHYTELNVKPEDFECIYNVYMQNGMSTSELSASEHILEHFGIPYKYILINQEISNIQGAVIDKEEDNELDKEAQKPEEPKQEQTKKVDYCKILTGKSSQVIVCANKYKYARFLEQVKEHKLSYIPFRVVFGKDRYHMVVVCQGSLLLRLKWHLYLRPFQKKTMSCSCNYCLIKAVIVINMKHIKKIYLL